MTDPSAVETVTVAQPDGEAPAPRLNPFLFWAGIGTALIVIVWCIVSCLQDPSGLVLTDAILVGASTFAFMATLLGLTSLGAHPIRADILSRLRVTAAVFLALITLINTYLIFKTFPKKTHPSVESVTLVGILMPTGVALILAIKDLVPWTARQERLVLTPSNPQPGNARTTDHGPAKGDEISGEHQR